MFRGRIGFHCSLHPNKITASGKDKKIFFCHFVKIENLNDENFNDVSCLCIVQHHDSVKEQILQIYNQGKIPLIYDCQHKISKKLQSKSILEFLGE